MAAETEKTEQEKVVSKRKKDQFSITIVGIFIYSILLILVVGGTYLGVKTFYKSRQSAVDQAVRAAEDEAEAKTAAEAEKRAKEAEEAAKAAAEASVQNAEEVTEPEEELKEKLIDVTELLNQETMEIDYSQEVIRPAKWDGNAKWKDKVFSRLENVSNPSQALVNTYDFSRKFAVKDTDKKLEFMIFTNPETDKTEKITTKEYCGEDVEISSYYYDNGNLNYAIQYRQAVDLPINLSTTEVTSRYYFNRDTMVKYLYCAEGSATEYTVEDFDSYSDGTKEQYRYLEQTILNSATINYNMLRNLEEKVTFAGYVLDEFNSGMDEASIRLTDNAGEVVLETLTNPDGYYSFVLPADNAEVYTMTVNKGQLDPVTVYHLRAARGEERHDIEPIYLAYTETGAVYNVQIMVRDAANAITGLAEGTLRLRSGFNNYEGDVIATGVLDATGAITAPLKAGCYTAEVQKGGYEVCYFSVVVKSDHQAVLGYAVADVGENEVVTTLSWDTTLDLDLRMFSSGGARKDKSGLDSVGPTMAEMLRTTKLDADSFECFVNDYSNCAGGDFYAYSLSGSNATVCVYSSDGLQATLHVPAGHIGVVWKPFEIRNARVLAINHFYFSDQTDSFWSGKE